MYITSITDNRKELINKLGEITGIHPKYLNAPTFGFQIGPYTVLRNGDIEVEESSADAAILGELAAAGYIELPGNPAEAQAKEPADKLEISVPIAGHTGISLINIINTIYSKAALLNKSTGSGFYIPESVLAHMDENKPETIEAFLEAWEVVGPTTSGIAITEDKIAFEFPFTDDADRKQAYIELAALINKQAIDQKRVRAEKKEIENEKFTFRVWLVRIGMKGEKYKTARKILLENLSGNSAFLTEEKAAAHRDKYKAMKEEEPCGEKEA